MPISPINLLLSPLKPGRLPMASKEQDHPGLDTLFDGRPIARFWFLETVARMPGRSPCSFSALLKD